MTRIRTLLHLLALTGFAIVAGAQVSTGTDDSAQLPFWQWQDTSVSIRLVQRLPDQSRAFFRARQFSAAHAERIAQSCVFQTVFKNIAAPGSGIVINYDLTQWEIRQQAKRRTLKVKEQWLAEWEQSQAPQSARIAFAWSLLPTQQQFQAGDYNWGMTTYDLPPGQRFDLHMVWFENQQRKTAVIHDIECAPDVELNPRSGIAG